MYLSVAERERRFKELREAMGKENVEAFLVIGNGHATGSPLFATGSFRYLTDFFIMTLYGILVLFREDKPVMLLPGDLQKIYADKYSWIDDVRVSSNYAESIVALLTQKGIQRGKVGIVGIDSIPVSTYLPLLKNLPHVEFFDATSIILPLRFIKSNEEIGLMKRSAELNDAAYEEVLKRLRPGMKEHEIVGILDGYHRGNGSDRVFNLISSGPFPASKEGIPFVGLPWYPSQREINKGDCVLLEMTNVYGGYWSQLVRVVSIGVDNSELRRFHKAAVRTMAAAEKKMKIGTKTAQVVASMAEAAKRDGLKLTPPAGHFVGIDLIEARVELNSPIVLEPGMTAILHPCILDEKSGVNIIFWGQTYLVTENGPEKLNSTDDRLHII